MARSASLVLLIALALATPVRAQSPEDADGDRIADDDDVCPGSAETANGFEDADGCPDVDGAAVRELAERIHFATGEHVLGASARPVVRRLAALLRAHAEIASAEIVGHADARGDDAANLALSERRAEAVRDALVEAGVTSERITTVGRGALPGDSPAIQAENRRCDVRIVLTADPRDAAGLTPILGRWIGDASFDLDVGEHASDARIEMRDGAPESLGAAHDLLDGYAARAVGDRFVLVLRSVDREATVSVRLVSPDRAEGFVESLQAGHRTRVPWAGHRVGTFDQQSVVRMITTRRSAIQACYERELRTDATLAGRIVVQMTIEPSGETVGVHVTVDTTIARSPVGPCLVRVIDAFAFDPGPMGGAVSYTFPFVFEPAETTPVDAGGQPATFAPP